MTHGCACASDGFARLETHAKSDAHVHRLRACFLLSRDRVIVFCAVTRFSAPGSIRAAGWALGRTAILPSVRPPEAQPPLLLSIQLNLLRMAIEFDRK